MNSRTTISRWGIITLAMGLAVLIIGGALFASRQNPDTSQAQQRQRLLRQFRRTPTPFVSEYMTLVDLSRKAGDFAIAIEVLKSAAAEQPKNAFIFELLGDVYQEASRFPAAEAAYRRAIVDDAGAVLAYTKFADLLWEHVRERAGEIEPLLATGIKVTAHPNLYKRLARYFTDIGDRRRAVEAWEAVLRLEPETEAVKEEIQRLK